MDRVGAGVNSDRVFRVLVDELSFASDFYYVLAHPVVCLGRLVGNTQLPLLYTHHRRSYSCGIHI